MKKRISTKKLINVIMNMYLLNWKLSEKGIFGYRLQGNIDIFPPYINDIVKYARLPGIYNVLKVGFKYGHTVVTLLSANKKVNVVSFDEVKNYFIFISKNFIDSTFPNRHKLITGFINDNVKKFHNINPNYCFNLIIFDGNQSYDQVMTDVLACMPLANDRTILIINHTILSEKKQKLTENNTGPTRARDQLIADNKIKLTAYHKYNKITGISVCYYIK